MLQCPSNGQCYSKHQICDGIFDCEDGHDEKNCSDILCHEQGMFLCPPQTCILHSLHCDGVPDCEDAHDELFNCSNCETFTITLTGTVQNYTVQIVAA